MSGGLAPLIHLLYEERTIETNRFPGETNMERRWLTVITTLNQVCYAGGSVTLDGGPLTTPGQVATLDGVSGLTLVSPDAGHWSVALLRLAADSPTPDPRLTLLAFGNVESRNLTLFDAAAGNRDVAPALSFSSNPVPGLDPEMGGLIVYDPTPGEPLSINLNGADLTLASSAIVQAQPWVKMIVTMATGSALVNTAADDGTAADAPATPTTIEDRLLEPLVPHYEGDLLTPLVPPLLVRSGWGAGHRRPAFTFPQPQSYTCECSVDGVLTGTITVEPQTWFSVEPFRGNVFLARKVDCNASRRSVRV
jgi:hypothetical protein